MRRLTFSVDDIKKHVDFLLKTWYTFYTRRRRRKLEKDLLNLEEFEVISLEENDNGD